MITISGEIRAEEQRDVKAPKSVVMCPAIHAVGLPIEIDLLPTNVGKENSIAAVLGC